MEGESMSGDVVWPNLPFCEMVRLELFNGDTLIFFEVEEGNRVHDSDLQLNEMNGERWSATLLTLEGVRAIIDRRHESGDSFSGAYFHCPYLLIVDVPTVESVVGIVEGLIRDGTFRSVLSPLGPEDDYSDLHDDGGA